MNSPGRCYTIPPGQPFLQVLAGWVLAQYGSDPATFTRTLVLLPGRRACRSLREAFLELTGGKPTLLPRIQPIGDTEEEAWGLFNGTADMPPPISPLRRQLLLMRLVRDFEKQRQGRIFNAEKAAQLAAQLARLIDDAAREDLDFAALDALAPEDLARHWQQTLDFLKIVSLHWPRLLETEGAMDPVAYRTHALKSLAANLEKHPPAYPVIAAGSTGSQPATAGLLSVITRLPRGMVVLPGLDVHMPEAEWEWVRETHPQFLLKQLLHTLGCKRQDVQLLAEHTEVERASCIRAVFRPPEATPGWLQAEIPYEKGFAQFHTLSADTLLDEARMISILLRETLELPGKTAALVTPDRTLARMVASAMQRFGVALDDSAGQPLKACPAGVYLRLVAEVASSAGAPASLLALLRHPFAAAGMDTAECRQLAGILEKNILRGVRKKPGLASLRDAAKYAKLPALEQMLADMAKHMEPFAVLFERRKPIPLRTLLCAHIAFAEWLATTNAENGKDRLWAKESGNHLAHWLDGLMEQSDLLDSIDPHIYPGMFETLLAQETYWPKQGQHPRLHILSPIEARLQHFDRVILGGLNEGSWPALPEADPWMSRPMRAAFGLPASERAVGQAAHDVSVLCHAPEVWLTRARKVDGIPTVASRWLVRLKTLVEAKDQETYGRIAKQSRYDVARLLLDEPLPCADLKQPAPTPPLAARPDAMSVTAVDTWLRDPYIIYARYVLRLHPLEALDRDPDARDFGTLVHRALEQFTRQWPSALPGNAYEKLLACGKEAFAAFLDRPAVESLWWPRFEAIAQWLLAREEERRGQLQSVMAEIEGRWKFDVDGKAFTLKTRIDRLEIGKDGSATIIDYKTGAVPTDKDQQKGLANQLPLEALIAAHGTLSPAPGAALGDCSLEYWKLSGNTDKCEISAVEGNLEQARQMLENLIRRFNNASEPYAAQDDPRLVKTHNDYEHLTRRQEWETL